MLDRCLEVVEIVIQEIEGIDTDILLTIKDDILREKLLNVNILIANIEALKDNPAPSSDVMTSLPPCYLTLFLVGDNTFDNSLTESFCFDLGENSSGSTTTYSDYSLPDYEAFYSDDDHIEEKRCPGFLKPLVLAVFVLRSQELHNPQLHLGIPIS
ncbi:hypothetical protein Tco_1409429 [Tanacetum coccineum]